MTKVKEVVIAVVNDTYTIRFAAGCKRTAEGIVIMAQVASEVREEYGYTAYINWLSMSFGLKQRMGNNLLAVHRNLITANFAVDVDWAQFAPSALYYLASPSTPEEAIAEAIEMAEGGEVVTHAIAKGIVKRLTAMNDELADASHQVTDFVIANEVDDPELVQDLKRLEASQGKPGSNGTFDEIMATGGFHYGDSMGEWCDVTNDPAKTRYEALKSIARSHIPDSIPVKVVARPVAWEGGDYVVAIGEEGAPASALKVVGPAVSKGQANTISAWLNDGGLDGLSMGGRYNG